MAQTQITRPVTYLYLSVDFDEKRTRPATVKTYRGIVLEVSRGESNKVEQRFFTGDYDADYNAMVAFVLSIMPEDQNTWPPFMGSSSVDTFEYNLRK